MFKALSRGKTLLGKDKTEIREHTITVSDLKLVVQNSSVEFANVEVMI